MHEGFVDPHDRRDVGGLEPPGEIGDRLEIDNDIFDVGREAFPRLRTRLCFEIVSRFWLVAGIDNALNTNRDFFLGLQLRFDDEDLKSLLPFSGSLRP